MAKSKILRVVLWMVGTLLSFSVMAISIRELAGGNNSSLYLHLDIREAFPLLGVAIAGLTSHYRLSNAFRAGDATLMVPLDFMRIPLIAVVGWVFYGERLDVFVVFGALIIVGGVLWDLRSETARAC